MRTVKRIFASIFILALTVITAQAQNTSRFGSITGVVTERSSGETLIGVNVGLSGTSIGSPTNIEGIFEINRVPVGTYTLVASSIGYRTFEVEVEVTGGEELELNIVLVQEAVEGDEVIISAQAQGQRSAINEQISAREIKNVVSADKIRELPDQSAAAALSRLPGVSLQNGSQVVIRGIQASQNMVMVNGIQLPSTEANNRATNLGFISSNLLSGVEVTKAVTPDMDHNTIGGTVNLKLREAPEDLHFDFLGQGGYNTHDDTYNNYQFWASISNRFLDNKLGVFIQANTSKSDGGQDFAQAGFTGIRQDEESFGTRPFAISNVTYGDQIRISSNTGGSVILDYKLPEGKIVAQNTIAFTNNDFVEQNQLLDIVNLGRSFRIERDIFDQFLLVNSIQSEHKIGPFNADFAAAHSYSEKSTDLNYGNDYGFRSPVAPLASPPSIDTRYNIGLRGIFDLELTEGDSVWQEAGIIENGTIRDEDYYERIYNLAANFALPVTVNENISGEIKFGGLYRYSERENEQDISLTRLSQISPPNYNEETRAYLESITRGGGTGLPLAFIDFRDYNYDRGDFLNGDFDLDYYIDVDIMDQFNRIAPNGWNAPGFNRIRSAENDYSGNETTTAAYLMADFKLGEKLSGLVGVRMEQANFQYQGNFVRQTDFVNANGRIFNDPETIPTDSAELAILEYAKEITSSDKTVTNFLPNLQLRYEATDWFDIRFAYTKTLSRPNYNSLLPRVFIGNAVSGTGNSGNPDLEPAVSDNLDLYFSFYNNKIGLFTIGGFYKRIENVFYGITRLYSQLPEGPTYPDSAGFARLGLPEPTSAARISTTFNNPNPAYLRGLEFDWQTTFWYLPKPFNNMVLNVNYTTTFSEMEYPQIEISEETVFVNGRPRVVIVESDTSRVARLPQQGDNTINVALGADYKGFSGRISFRMQDDVITGIGNRPENDSFTGKLYGWDFNLSQNLPVDGLSMFLNGVNIFYQPGKTFRRFSNGYERNVDNEVTNFNVNRNLSRLSYNPRRFQLGVRYRF